MGKNKVIITVDGTPFFRPIDGITRYSCNFILELARALPEIEFRILAFQDDRKKTSLVPKLTNIKITYLFINRKIYKGIFSRIVSVPIDWLLPFRPKFHIGTDFASFPYLKKVKKIIVVHDLAFLDYPKTMDKRNVKYLSRIVPWSINRASAVICVSDFTKQRLTHHYPRFINKIFLKSSCGVGNNFTKTLDKNHIEHVKNKYNLPNKYILTVGTIEPRKNLLTLAKAIETLPDQKKSHENFVILGKNGWGDISMKASKNILYTGYVKDKDLPAIYQGSSKLVFTSLYEGFGLPVLEAMASNIPVISSNIASVKEFAKKSILYSSPKDYRKFARLIQAKYPDGLLKSARDRALQLDWKNSVSQVVDYLKKNIG